jgi:hypothetical protein
VDRLSWFCPRLLFTKTPISFESLKSQARNSSGNFAIFTAIRRPSSLLEQLGRPLSEIREPRPEVQFGQGSKYSRAKGARGWLLGTRESAQF